jgi:monoamine oxidase
LRKDGAGYGMEFQAAAGKSEIETADSVVLALPFSVLREVDISKAGFDALKRKAIKELGDGRNAKTQLQFRARHWNGTGTWPGVSTGSSYSETGYQCGWDATRAQTGASGILNFYSGGSVTLAQKAKQPFTSNGNAQARTDAETALAAGEPVFPGLANLWNGKFTQSLPHLHPLMRASYAYYRVGQYSAFGGYEGVPQGQVFFAGDHTSMDFQGFMEGGASEGERAAKEVLAT